MGGESVTNRIDELKEEILKTPKNKGTEHHLALLKAKMAKLKTKLVSSGGGSKGKGFFVKKSGDATVIMIGFPSVGKSTLLNALTNQVSKVAAYAFTTLTMIPGILKYKGAEIQILDVPGIIEGAASGRGRGKEVLSAAQNADLLLILLDARHPDHYKKIIREIHDADIRINQEKPDIKVIKKIKGGIDIGSTLKLTKITKSLIMDVM